MSTGWTPTPNDAGTASPAGWYPDPQQFGVLRYWDGGAWTSHTNTPGPGPIAAPQTMFVAPPTVPFGVARALRIMLTIQAVAYALLVLVGLNYHVKGNNYLDRPTLDRGDAASAAESSYEGLWAIFLLSGIACGVLLIIWSYQTAKWAQSQGAVMRHTPGWAIGGWFIPCANYFIPFRVLNDLYRYAEPGLPRPIYQRHEGRPGCNFLWGWILGLIVTQVLSTVADGFSTEDATIGDVRTALTLRVLVPIVASFSVLMMLLYVRATNARLERTVATTYAGAGAVPYA